MATTAPHNTRNPAVSAEQYGLALAVMSGGVRERTGMTKEVAKEIVERTPHAQRVKFAKELSSHTNPRVRMVPLNKHIFDSQVRPLIRSDMSFSEYNKEYPGMWVLMAGSELVKLEGKKELKGWWRDHSEWVHKTYESNPKKKGPIGSALETLSKTGKYAVGAADEQLGRVLNPTTKVERFGREAEAKAYKRLLEAEGWTVSVEFEPDVKAEKWKATATRNPKRVTQKEVNSAAASYQRMQAAYGENNMATQRAYAKWVDLNALRQKQKIEATERKRNPEDSAADMYKSFHGKDSDSIEEYIEEEHYHGHLAQLGDLIELKVQTVSGYDVTLSFDGMGVLLASNENGDQLYIVGGDQSLPLAKIHMDGDYVKDSMVIGEAYFISYFTEKDFDKFESIIYEHEFGEDEDTYEKVPCPTLRYDNLNSRLYLDGGAYVIKKPLFETSRGIER